MQFKNFRLYFSYPRTERYLISTNYSNSKCIELYHSNLKVSESFYSLLSILEIILRNRINDILTNYFNDQHWITNQKNGFMSHKLLSIEIETHEKLIKHLYLKNEVLKSEKKLKNRKQKITNSKILAEQTFGFWISFFEVHHYKILEGKPIQIFKNLPKNGNRKLILEKLNQIRHFRNRLYHNEPICFRGNSIDFNYTNEIYETIISLLNWIDPEITTFTLPLDHVNLNINNLKNLAKNW